MNLSQFLNTPQLRNVWLKEDGIAVYVRKATRIIGSRVCIALDAANCEVEESRRRQGIMKRWLATAENLAKLHGLECVYIENVLNPVLDDFFLQQGYKCVDPRTCSYAKELQ